MANQLPSLQAAFLDERTGAPSPQWVKFFAALAQGPKAAQPQAVAASPYTYTASVKGHLIVAGGTVSAISLIRGRTTIATGLTSGFLPVSLGDQVQITYSSAPTVTFLPA